MKFLIVMGSPGSGKSTYAHMLQETTEKSFIISCGEIYRANHGKATILDNARRISKAAWIQALTKFIIQSLKLELKKVASDTEYVIIDGLWENNLAEFEKEIAPISEIHYLNCTYDIAKSRLLARERYDDFPAKIDARLSEYFSREQQLLAHLNRVYAERLKQPNIA